MPKVAIGSILQKTIIEGDENLLTQQEILIKESKDFKYILKERKENGEVETYVVLPLDDYIEKLEEAYREGNKYNGGNS